MKEEALAGMKAYIWVQGNKDLKLPGLRQISLTDAMKVIKFYFEEAK